MPYAILRDGAPVEIPLGKAWTSTQYKVGTDSDPEVAAAESAELEAAIGTMIALEVGHPANVLTFWDADDRARYGVLAFDQPVSGGNALVGYALSLVDGAVVAAGGAVPVPQEVDAVQLLEQIRRDGRIDAVNGYIAAASADVQLWFARAVKVRRANQMLIDGWHACSFTDDALDAAFRSSALIPL